MSINLNPRQILKMNLYLILFLLLAHITGIISKYYFAHDHVYGLVSLFDFDFEKNIPTLYSSLALIVASVLLSLIANANKKIGASYIPWYGLSLIFLFLSIDEIASIHERLITPVRDYFGAAGLLYFSWVIPYALALVVFIFAYSKFLLQLPRNIMFLFLVSGTTFVLGAIGFELIGGRYYELYGSNSIIYSLITTCEELLEMLGIAIFIYTLLTYIVSEFKFLKINIEKT